MPSVSDARRSLLSALQSAGIEIHEAHREADLIIEHASGMTKAQQMGQPEAQLTNGAWERIEHIRVERQRRVPLQYLIGEQWFMGLPFKVFPGVLIPRADTETLVEVALKFLRRLPAPVFVDIGCGSGCVAVSLLHHLPAARAYAVDVSETAIRATGQNALALGVLDRLTLRRQDWLQFNPGEQLDAVLSNPPYIPRSHAAELQPEVAVYEPDEALFGSGEDGLGFYRALSGGAGALLRPRALIAVEVGQGQSEAVIDIFRSGGWCNVSSQNDLGAIPRCISAFHAVGDLER